jgi:TonB family protein
MDPLSLVLKSSILLAAAGLVTQCLRRQSAAFRHLVWLLAMAALPLLPLLTRTLPALPVTSPAPLFRTTVTAGGGASAGVAAALPLDLFSLWALGAGGMLLHLAISLLLLRRLRRRATGTHSILRSAPSGTMPLTFGHFRPVILLPADAAAWPAPRRRHAVLHEIAHIRRHDFAAHVFARFVLALYWWQPLAWLAWRRLLVEREMAADDLVLGRGVRPSEYAQSLLHVAAALPPAPFAIAMARRLPFENRLRAILSARTVRTAPGLGTVAFAVVAWALMVLPLATVSAQSPATPPALQEGLEALRRKAYEEAFARFSRLDPARAALWQAITRESQGQDAAAEQHFEQAVALAAGDDGGQLVALRLYGRFLRQQAGRQAGLQAIQARQAALQAKLAPPAAGSAPRLSREGTRPRLLTKVEPEYSEEARAAKIDGAVVLSVVIDRSGRPVNLRVIRGLGLGLDERAIAAVAQWRFEPGRENGEPVDVQATVEVNFRLL